MNLAEETTTLAGSTAVVQAAQTYAIEQVCVHTTHKPGSLRYQMIYNEAVATFLAGAAFQASHALHLD